MRRILLLSILASFLIPMEVASAEICPDSWGYVIPELTFTKSTKKIGSEFLNYRSSTLGPGISNEDWNLNRPELFPESIWIKIKNLGIDVAIDASYQVYNNEKLQIDYSSWGASWTKGFVSEPDWLLLSRGIWNGTKINYEMTISQKNCRPYTLKSNVYTFSDLYVPSFDLDEFLVTFPNASTDRVLNFKQIDLLKSAITSNIETIQASNSTSATKLNTLRPIVGTIVGYLVVGVSPAGCIVGRNPRHSPAFDPVDVVIVQKPCSGGVLMNYAQSELDNWALVTQFDLNRDIVPIQSETPEAKMEAQKKLIKAMTEVELKAKQEADAKAAAELKAKQDAEAKAAADLLAKQIAAASKASASKKTTITCIKGKTTKKVTAVKPVCPKGYKKM